MGQGRLEDTNGPCCPLRIPRKYSIHHFAETSYSLFKRQREVYHKDSTGSFWKSVDETLADIRQKEASVNGLRASE